MSRVAIVTGASSGIGKASVQLLQQQGITTIGVSRKISNSDYGRRCDVSQEASVKSCFNSILKQFGRIDILVNSAGVAGTQKALDLNARDWNEMLGVNLLGSYWTCKYALPSMVRQKYGKIINISSKAGRSYSQTSSLAYTCSKYGVIGLTRQLAAEFASKNIQINCVCPSQVNTEMLRKHVSKADLKKLAQQSPIQRLAEPEEVAHVVAFLASDAASYMSGSIVDVHGAKL